MPEGLRAADETGGMDEPLLPQASRDGGTHRLRAAANRLPAGRVTHHGTRMEPHPTKRRQYPSFITIWGCPMPDPSVSFRVEREPSRRGSAPSRCSAKCGPSRRNAGSATKALPVSRRVLPTAGVVLPTKPVLYPTVVSLLVV